MKRKDRPMFVLKTREGAIVPSLPWLWGVHRIQGGGGGVCGPSILGKLFQYDRGGSCSGLRQLSVCWERHGSIPPISELSANWKTNSHHFGEMTCGRKTEMVGVGPT